MSGVLVLAETDRREESPSRLRPLTYELIAAGRRLCDQGAGPLAVALHDHAPEEHAQALDVAGVSDVVLVRSPSRHFEGHIAQAALERLIEARRPAVVLCGHTMDSLAFAAAAAARAGHGFASDVIELSFSAQEGLRASRSAYGERLVAQLDFPDKQTVVLLLRTGAFAQGRRADTPTAPQAATASVGTLELGPSARARTEHVEFRPAPSEEEDITKADVLLSVGRGIGDGESIPRFERLARRMGGTLCVSGPLVEAGWASGARKVGQSGRTVAPRVYLALGISGAAQHVAGMSGSQTIVAVNSDPRARIFDIAHYGAVADLFEIATELERHVQRQGNRA
jgi:electron transfer flavoprotein alpha subunit